MLKKIFGASFDVKIGALIATIGAGMEFMSEQKILIDTKYGKWIALGGLLYSTWSSKSSKVTGTGNAAARVPDVCNVPIQSNPNR